MFAQFIIPYDFDSHTGAYTWVVHKAAQGFKSDLRLIAPWDYWIKSSEIINITKSVQFDGDYEYLTSRELTQFDFNSIDFVYLDKEYYRSRYSCTPQAKVFSLLQDEVDEKLQSDVQHGLVSDPRFEALLLWTNCRSAVEAAKVASVPTIFNEVGPLRPPVYHPTAYFDFGGLHDQAQALARWSNFNSKAASVPILERSSLCNLLRRTPIVERGDKTAGAIGIALQYPGGAHLKYSADFTNECLIDLATRHFDGKIIIRPHPGARMSSSARSIAYDESKTPEEFIRKCDIIITINSGIAFESILLGKETYVLGHSPIAMGAWDIIHHTPKMDIETEIRWLNWFVFAYLMPFSLLFNPEYYRWRLTTPSEEDIYMRNFSWWMRHRGRCNCR